jgi:hypothetical protein
MIRSCSDWLTDSGLTVAVESNNTTGLAYLSVEWDNGNFRAINSIILSKKLKQ